MPLGNPIATTKAIHEGTNASKASPDEASGWTQLFV